MMRCFGSNLYRMDTKNFYIDGWLVEPELGQVTSRSRTVRLEPQVMRVLVYLAARHGDVVTKKEIIGALWQGRYTSDAVLARCIFSIRRVLKDDRKQPRIIRTIPKIGYKMVAEVTKPKQPATSGMRIGLVAAAAIVVAIGALALSHTGAKPVVEISTTVVETVGIGDDALFLDSLTNVLDIELRNEISAAGGRMIGVKDSSDEVKIGVPAATHQLNTQIGIDGSQVSILMTVSDKARSGDDWQRKYLVDTSDGLDAVSSIVEEVTGELGLSASSAGGVGASARNTSSIVAYDLYRQGAEYFQNLTVGSNLSAIALFESALEHDPNYGLAHAGLSAALSMQIRYWNGRRRGDALHAAKRAIELEPDRAESHYALGEALAMDPAKRQRAMESLARALVIDPAHAEALRSSAALFRLDKDFEKAKTYYARALDLEPGDPFTMKMLGSTYFHMGDFDNAHHWLIKSYKGIPYSVSANAQLAVLDLMNGATDKAISRCDRLLKLDFASYTCMRVAAASSIVAGDMIDAGMRFDAMSKRWPNDGYVQLGQAYVLLSDDADEQAQQIIDSVLEQAYRSIAENNGCVENLRLVAVGHVLQGQTPKAYEILENATERGRAYDPWDEVDPLLDKLRDDDRFDSYIASTKPLYW